MKHDIIKNVRDNSPLIHHLTNHVVENFSANGLLSFGAIPVMGKAVDEAADMASVADGVLLNIGTLTSAELPSMILAGQAANAKGAPVLLDPVGVAATPFRRTAVKTILENVQPTVIKGNAGELAHLVDIPWETKGVDSIGEGRVDEIAANVSEKFQTVSIATGQTDIISADNDIIHNRTGHPLLSKVTGSGCLLGSVVAACLTTADPIKEQVTAAVTFYGLAGEYAMKHPHVNGPGTFLPHFIDALSLDPEEIERT